MNDIVLREQVRAQVAIRTLVERLTEREEGQTSIEYVGIIAVVALVVGALITAAGGFGSDLVGGINTAIQKVLPK